MCVCCCRWRCGRSRWTASGPVSATSARARAPSPPSQTHSRTSSDTHTHTCDATRTTQVFKDEPSVNQHVGHLNGRRNVVLSFDWLMIFSPCSSDALHCFSILHYSRQLPWCSAPETFHLQQWRTELQADIPASSAAAVASLPVFYMLVDLWTSSRLSAASSSLSELNLVQYQHQIVNEWIDEMINVVNCWHDRFLRVSRCLCTCLKHCYGNQYRWMRCHINHEQSATLNSVLFFSLQMQIRNHGCFFFHIWCN